MQYKKRCSEGQFAAAVKIENINRNNWLAGGGGCALVESNARPSFGLGWAAETLIDFIYNLK